MSNPVGMTLLAAAAIVAAIIFGLWGVPWIEEAIGGKGANYSTAAPWGME